MKTLNQKIAFFLASFMLAANFSVLANGKENKTDSAITVVETSFTVEESMSEAELDEIIFSLEDETRLPISVSIRKRFVARDETD